jgi:hypothetical protein
MFNNSLRNCSDVIEQSNYGHNNYFVNKTANTLGIFATHQVLSKIIWMRDTALDKRLIIYQNSNYLLLPKVVERQVHLRTYDMLRVK